MKLLSFYKCTNSYSIFVFQIVDFNFQFGFILLVLALLLVAMGGWQVQLSGSSRISFFIVADEVLPVVVAEFTTVAVLVHLFDVGCWMKTFWTSCSSSISLSSFFLFFLLFFPFLSHLQKSQFHSKPVFWPEVSTHHWQGFSQSFAKD